MALWMSLILTHSGFKSNIYDLIGKEVQFCTIIFFIHGVQQSFPLCEIYGQDFVEHSFRWTDNVSLPIF